MIAIHQNFPQCFKFKTLEEGELVAKKITNQLGVTDDVYIGLVELIINAIEHGNLAIDYQTKTKLIENNQWLEEVQKRSQISPFKDRFVEVVLDENINNYIITVTDQGEGFDWLNFTNFISSEDTEKHGRGIMIAQMVSFDHVAYLGNGNCVKCFLSKARTKQ